MAAIYGGAQTTGKIHNWNSSIPLGEIMGIDSQVHIDNPIQEELSHLKYQIQSYKEAQQRTAVLLQIVRAKLVAVKKLVK